MLRSVRILTILDFKPSNSLPELDYIVHGFWPETEKEQNGTNFQLHIYIATSSEETAPLHLCVCIPVSGRLAP